MSSIALNLATYKSNKRRIDRNRMMQTGGDNTGAPAGMKLPPVVDRIAKQTDNHKAPICVLMVGMAGSGKTTLLSALQQSTVKHVQEEEGEEEKAEADTTVAQSSSTEEDGDKKPAAQESSPKASAEESGASTKKPDMPAYCVNLDPATLNVPYNPSIDIRDTVDYKQVMHQHNLGPNGAIMTSLNLYATKFDQVIGILEGRADKNEMSDYLLIDTPGQIEAFTWSASGSIISESLASTFPTVMVFVVDTVRCSSSPNTFMSNMLYACSMFYRTRLPLVIAFNKTDVVSSEFCMEWMKDYEAFQDALDDARKDNEGGFYDSLTRSLSMVLDEFYSQFSKNAVGVSAITGDGIDDFWKVIDNAATEDFADYIEDLKHRIEEQQAKKMAIARASARRFQRDVDADNQARDEQAE